MKSLVQFVLESIDSLIKEYKDDNPSIFEVLFSGKYKTSYKGAPNLLFPRKKLPLYKRRGLTSFKNSINSTIYRLQKQGFIEKGEKRGKWKITQNGIKKLEFLKSQLAKNLLLPTIKISKEKSKDKIIFIFDVPEKERRKRDWLRQQLRLLEFTQLQKSVWIGDNKIPKQLIEAFGAINILSNIHIFRIKDSGTIAT